MWLIAFTVTYASGDSSSVVNHKMRKQLHVMHHFADHLEKIVPGCHVPVLNDVKVLFLHGGYESQVFFAFVKLHL